MPRAIVSECSVGSFIIRRGHVLGVFIFLFKVRNALGSLPPLQSSLLGPSIRWCCYFTPCPLSGRVTWWLGCWFGTAEALLQHRFPGWHWEQSLSLLVSWFLPCLSRDSTGFSPSGAVSTYLLRCLGTLVRVDS